MYRSSLFLGLLFVAPAALGQTTSTDSQALQALLSEVRQLRQDLQSYSVTAERTQILLFRLQLQQTVVVRISQRSDDADAKLRDVQTARKKAEAEAKGVHDSLEQSQNPADRKSFENMDAYYKGRLEALAEQEQQAQTKQIEAAEQLRIEQAKLDDLQARLDELDRGMPKGGSHPK